MNETSLPGAVIAAYDLWIWLDARLGDFPAWVRHGAGRRIGDAAVDVLDHLLEAALARARAWSRTYAFYAHLDVVRFFPAIDHAIVAAQLRQDVGEPWLRDLCARILAAGAGDTHRAHFPGDDLLRLAARKTDGTLLFQPPPRRLLPEARRAYFLPRGGASSPSRTLPPAQKEERRG